MAAAHSMQGLVPLAELHPLHGAGIFSPFKTPNRISIFSMLEGSPGHRTDISICSISILTPSFSPPKPTGGDFYGLIP